MSDHDRCFYKRDVPDLNGPVGEPIGREIFPCNIRRRDHVKGSPGGDHSFTGPLASDAMLRWSVGTVLERWRERAAELRKDNATVMYNDSDDRAIANSYDDLRWEIKAVLNAPAEAECDVANGNPRFCGHIISVERCGAAYSDEHSPHHKERLGHEFHIACLEFPAPGKFEAAGGDDARLTPNRKDA